MMEEMERSWEELKAFCKQYWKNREIRKRYAKACADRGDTDEQISMLEHSLSMDGAFVGLVSEYSLKLKKL